MFKFFLTRADRARNGAGGDDAGPGWVRDPLSHPDIAAMDERQRADLPFQGVARARPDYPAAPPTARQRKQYDATAGSAR